MFETEVLNGLLRVVGGGGGERVVGYVLPKTRQTWQVNNVFLISNQIFLTNFKER